MRSVVEIFPEISIPKKIVITCHQKPDGDAMGSMLGLFHFLGKFDHELTAISPTNWADFLSWMPGCKQVINFDSRAEYAKQKIAEADWIFCLDYNTFSRVKNMKQALIEAKCVKILIDHHESPDLDSFTFGVSNPARSSTAEMVYDLIESSGYDDRIDDPIAQCLYAGVMTDTGSFRFDSTTPSVHLMVARLMETGFDHSKVHERLFDNFLENRYRFFGNALLHRMEVFYEYNTALIAIPQKDLIRYELRTGDTEGLVNLPLGIKGIKMAALIIDRGEAVKSSFRSKGEFDVNVFARKYFNGGGHVSASGGMNTEPLEDVVSLFKRAMEENQLLLAD